MGGVLVGNAVARASVREGDNDTGCDNDDDEIMGSKPFGGSG